MKTKQFLLIFLFLSFTFYPVKIVKGKESKKIIFKSAKECLQYLIKNTNENHKEKACDSFFSPFNSFMKSNLRLWKMQHKIYKALKKKYGIGFLKEISLRKDPRGPNPFSKEKLTLVSIETKKGFVKAKLKRKIKKYTFNSTLYIKMQKNSWRIYPIIQKIPEYKIKEIMNIGKKWDQRSHEFEKLFKVIHEGKMKRKEVKKLFKDIMKKTQWSITKSEKASWETMAIANLRTIMSAEMQFKILKKKIGKDGTSLYGTLKELVQNSYLSKSLSSGKKWGYKYTIKILNGGRSFEATAIPLDKNLKLKSFFVNMSGRITFTKDGSVPNSKSKSIN